MEVAEIYQRHEDDTGDDDSADESSDESSSLGSDSDDEFQDDIIGRMNALDRNSDTGDDDDDDVGIETGRFNNKYITKLVRNYRSHPDILRVQLLYSISYCILSRPLPTQDRCYGVAEGGECLSWEKRCQLFVTPGNYFAIF